MSGGAWEYVMGVMLYSDYKTPCSGRDASLNSGFNGFYCALNQTLSLSGAEDFPSDSRYSDTYAYGITDEGYNRRILGDATGEMGPFQTKAYGTESRQIGSWHDDEAWFVYPIEPWFIRGAGNGFYVGVGAGIFNFDIHNGNADARFSFRIVLTF